MVNGKSYLTTSRLFFGNFNERVSGQSIEPYIKFRKYLECKSERGSENIARIVNYINFAMISEYRRKPFDNFTIVFTDIKFFSKHLDYDKSKNCIGLFKTNVLNNHAITFKQ